MPGADQRLFERGGLGASKLEHLPRAWGHRGRDGRGMCMGRGNQAFDFPAHCVALDVVAFEDLRQRIPSHSQHPKEHMFGSDEVVAQAQSFLTGEVQRCLSDRGKSAGGRNWNTEVRRTWPHRRDGAWYQIRGRGPAARIITATMVVVQPASQTRKAVDRAQGLHDRRRKHADFELDQL